MILFRYPATIITAVDLVLRVWEFQELNITGISYFNHFLINFFLWDSIILKMLVFACLSNSISKSDKFFCIFEFSF